MKILGLVAGCEDCPRRIYYSGGRYTCAEMGGEILPPLKELRGLPAAWCPLPNYPVIKEIS